MILSPPLRRLTLGLILAAGSILIASAQVEVVASGKIGVGIKPLAGTEGAAATGVLTADLARTMLMSPKVNGTDKFMASGTVTGSGLVGKLTNGGQEVVAKTYAGGWRKATHQFADDITQAVTGVKGIATSRVAFISGSGRTKELYVMDIDGANAVQLTNDHSLSVGPAWSRDGGSIAYTSYKGGYPDVYVINLASGNRTKIAGFAGINSGASFSPDGSQVALTLSKDGNPDIYTMSASGGTPTRLTKTRGSDTAPSWSPSGDKIVFSSDDRGSSKLFTISSSGGDLDMLSIPLGACTEPDWSPDGKKVTFTARRSGGFRIGVYNFSGSAKEVGNGQKSTWTRNSRHVVTSNGGSIYLIDTETGQSLKLDAAAGNAAEAVVSR